MAALRQTVWKKPSGYQVGWTATIRASSSGWVAWLYGAFGHNFLKTMVWLAHERQELRVVDDQRGSPTSTRDLAAAILRIAPRIAMGEDVWGTYHFTGSGVTTWHGFASCPYSRARPDRIYRVLTINAHIRGRKAFGYDSIRRETKTC
jgi:hypothetical protein